MRIPIQVYISVFLTFAAVQRACAFPDWMGVYDHYVRHDGQNPGRFNILMNQSYVGLEASVGLRINGGSWVEYPMSYVQDVDGNSRWEYIHAQPFTFGSVVEYYFHGFDVNTAENIYDSRGASNYISGPLSWGYPEVLEMFSVYPGNNPMSPVFASGGESLYLTAAYSGASTNFLFAKKLPGKSWVTLAGPGEEGAIGEFALAASGNRVLRAFRVDTNILSRFSSDGGETWTAPVLLGSLPENGSLAGISAAAGPYDAFGVAYGVATNCCGAQNIYVVITTNSSSNWSAPQAAFQFHDVGSYSSGMKMTGNAQGWYLAVREVYQGSSIIMLGGSSSNGSQWVTQHLGGDGNAWGEFDISASAGKVMIAADPYYNTSTLTWQYAPGGGWMTQRIDRALESGSQVWLGNDGGSTWYVYRYEDNDINPGISTYLPTYRVSTDDGNTWSYPAPVKYDKPEANDVVNLKWVRSSSGPKQQLVWFFNEYVGTFQRMYSYRVQESDGFSETLSISLLENGQVQLVASNLTSGMSHMLQSSASPDSGSWSDLASWSHGSTNVIPAPPSGSTGIAYRVKSSY